MVQPIGYIKLHRELVTKPIWLNSTPEQKTILITLLTMANFKPKQWEWQGKKFNVKAGQFITSSKSICDCCGTGITRQNVRTALARFEKLEFLTIESTKQGILVTITNWEVYQSDDVNITNELTIDQPTPNHQLTNDQPTPNHQLTTREERKKEKKEKNVEKVIIYSDVPELNVAILEFVDFRKKSKKPMTDRAITLLMDRLNKLSTDPFKQIEMINEAILRGWQTVYPEKATSEDSEIKIIDGIKYRKGLRIYE